MGTTSEDTGCPDDSNEGAETLETTFDWDGGPSATVAVLEAIEELSGRDLQSLDRLHNTIDPDALNALFQSGSDDTARNSGCVSFTVEEFTVTVHGDGTLCVTHVTE